MVCSEPFQMIGCIKLSLPLVESGLIDRSDFICTTLTGGHASSCLGLISVLFILQLFKSD